MRIEKLLVALLGVASVLVLAGSCMAQTQDYANQNSPTAKKISTRNLTRHMARPESLQFKTAGHPVQLTHRNLFMGRHVDISSLISNAKVPAPGSVHALPGLSRPNLLNAPAMPPISFRNANLSGLDTSKLLDAKRPDLRSAH